MPNRALVLDANTLVRAVLGKRVRETLGVILVAAERKLVTLEDALGRLQKTNFRVSPRLLKSIREGTARD